MRIKLIYDLAYSAALERFDTFIRTELAIIFKTPLIMLRMTQGPLTYGGSRRRGRWPRQRARTSGVRGEA